MHQLSYQGCTMERIKRVTEGTDFVEEPIELVEQSVIKRKKREKVKDDRNDFELNNWEKINFHWVTLVRLKGE